MARLEPVDSYARCVCGRQALKTVFAGRSNLVVEHVCAKCAWPALKARQRIEDEAELAERRTH